MASTLNQILRWPTQRKVWRYLCFASSVVGLICYAMSSSFNHLIGKWSLLKIFLYTVFSFIICLAILFAKTGQCSDNLQLKAHLAFLVLTITTVYSFFSDEEKQDAYSLISCAAFAMMSLGLSKQIHYGIEVDLLYFFCGCLIMQLMKIKLLLVMVGAGFSYSLIILRSSLDTTAESVHLLRSSLGALQDQDQHFVTLQVDLDSEQTNIDSAIHVDSTPIVQENENRGRQGRAVTHVESHSQQGLFAETTVKKRRLPKTYRKLIVEHNDVLNRCIMDRVDRYLQFPDDDSKSQNQLLVHPDELMQLPIIYEFRERLRFMMEYGFETECIKLYRYLRGNFLSKCLGILRVPKVKLREINKKNIKGFIDELKLVLKTLFPFERRLCRHLFNEYYSAECDIHSQKDSKIFEIELWTKFLELDSRMFSYIRKAAFPNCEVHTTTCEMMQFLRGASEDRDFSYCFQVLKILELLERNLVVKSKSFADPVLGYFFMLNNMRYIQMMAKDNSLEPLLGDDLNRIQTSYLQENLRQLRYESSEALKVEVESIEKILNSFNHHFQRACVEWCVIDENQRKETRRHPEDMVFELYQDFISMFSDDQSDKTVRYIRFRMFDILNRFNPLFHGTAWDDDSVAEKDVKLPKLVDTRNNFKKSE